MTTRSTADLYRLFTEAERLEHCLLCEYYYAKTAARHYRLLSICDRAQNRKLRRRAACIVATHSLAQNQLQPASLGA